MQTRGSAQASQSLTGSLERFRVWCSSPGADSDPENATGVNVRVTGNMRDLSQKNFEILVQSIGLRASPVILGLPTSTGSLSDSGAQSLTGSGWTWCFGVERAQAFEKSGDPVALLREEIDGIVLATGVLVSTHGPGQNVEFAPEESVC